MEKVKRILIYTNHFYPESFKVNDVASYLYFKGCEVTVITGIPNYPQGEFFKGYGLFSKRRENVGGVNVIRLPLIPRRDGGKFWLSLNYLSYALVALVHSFFVAFGSKYNHVLVHHTSPIFIALPAIIVKRIQKIELTLWNLDMWPEVVSANIRSRTNLLFKLLLKLVKWIYKYCDHMLIASKEYKPIMIERGVDESKIIYFPNWPEDIFFEAPKHDLPFDMPDGFNIVYAGNIGNTQDFESILKAILLVENEKINWVFVGEGRKKKWLEEKIKILKLEKRVFAKGRIPLEAVPDLYKKSDVLFASLVDMPIFTIPLKVSTYLSSGKPVICMMNGEGKDLVVKQNCGMGCKAGDYKALSVIATKLAESSEEELNNMGANGLKFCMSNFHPDQFKNKLDVLFKF